MTKYTIGSTIKVEGVPRICINEANFGTVALFNVSDDEQSETYEEDKKADIEKAEFFVRAVNNHDALVKVLQLLRGSIEFDERLNGSNPKRSTVDFPIALTLIDNALTAAGASLNPTTV